MPPRVGSAELSRRALAWMRRELLSLGVDAVYLPTARGVLVALVSERGDGHAIEVHYRAGYGVFRLDPEVSICWPTFYIFLVFGKAGEEQESYIVPTTELATDVVSLRRLWMAGNRYRGRWDRIARWDILKRGREWGHCAYPSLWKGPVCEASKDCPCTPQAEA